MDRVIDRPQLADFLRRSRARVLPSDVGLTDGPGNGLSNGPSNGRADGRRRRTPGLRREEVALLSGMSPDYYVRLEQARGPQPSTQLLGALARALKLTEDERDHLYLLGGHQPPAAAPVGPQIAPAVRYLLDQLTDTPVQVVSDLGDLLAQNASADRIFEPVCTVPVERRNTVWAWFVNSGLRHAYSDEEWELSGRALVADLRAAVTRRGPGDQQAAELVERLRASSAEFAEYWSQHEVATSRTRHLRLPGQEFAVETLLTPAADQRLLLFTPAGQ
ncbi:helix-turn-helix transcriptional regulator [Kitasatospora viridis]|uniref:Helix-turn-helix protein n=1 Tax=Kitasatospora viridis TaxID=281105 RepID=A0A561UBX0_9ACTN|nr:helix-turn-helix transcriptional regulator [Kitasatospora viridis]TWF96846.1 helix-turn-helix protein [Kitasatospora viridis]